jgi:hypothetical protein
MNGVGDWSAELRALAASLIPDISKALDSQHTRVSDAALYCLSSLRALISSDTPVPNEGNISIVLQQLLQKDCNLVRDSPDKGAL